MDKTSLGDRMKSYENCYRNYLTPRTPVIVRVDGRAFHTFTKGLKPFDDGIITSMMIATNAVAQQIQGFKLAYVQSDEASFLFTDYDTVDTQGWFGYNLQKVATITASTMTAWFNKGYPADYPAVFDGRAFNIPENDVANYFLWRYRDWQRNSIQMHAGTLFSHKELHGKSSLEVLDMCHEKGDRWEDLSRSRRNGVFFIKNFSPFCPDYKLGYVDIEKLVKEQFEQEGKKQ